MTNESQGPLKKVKYYNPPNVLRKKVGGGGIDPDRLQRAELYIQANDLDFTPIAVDMLARLEKAIADVKSGRITGKDTVRAIVGPVMELKANGGMFKYPLISEIADVVLNFLETVDELNGDGMEIIDVHQKTLQAIIVNRLKGSGGKEGTALTRELIDACNRYFKKYGDKERK